MDLREFLMHEPLIMKGPIFTSVRELASTVAKNPGSGRFYGKARSASAALSAVLRGERPLTSEVKADLRWALESHLSNAAIGERERILAEFDRFPVHTHRRRTASLEDEFNNLVHAVGMANDTLIIRPVLDPGAAVDSHPMRHLLIGKMGLSANATQRGHTRSGLPNFASARLTFVITSREHATRGWELFFLQVVGAVGAHPGGIEQTLAIDEAAERFEAIEDSNLLRIIVVDPELCLLPIHILEPASESAARGWVAFHTGPRVVRAVRMPHEYVLQFQRSFWNKLEAGELGGQERVRWSDLDVERIRSQAESLLLVRDET